MSTSDVYLERNYDALNLVRLIINDGNEVQRFWRLYNMEKEFETESMLIKNT